jgi:hypothetical protein
MYAMEQAVDPRRATGASAFAISVLTDLFGKSGVNYATIGMSVLVIAFAEVSTSPPRTSSARCCPRPTRGGPAARYAGKHRWRAASRTCCGRDAAGGDASGLKVEAPAPETWFVPGATSLRAQLKAFLTKKTHFALVVDEYNEVTLLVTLGTADRAGENPQRRVGAAGSPGNDGADLPSEVQARVVQRGPP